ncbi:hypothetical protein [Moorena sp. SIO4G3]|uniref:hypothetical protein n=1 Tax=Moorena sp. SIO4G3 TaxID=2607821 RepID=UPI00142BD76E|nr:hypothetical protein [Moorena sp. SIO4G3]NEO81926.1 hypothetical protein [Moorena sp. SIO4G3]
MGHLRSLVVLLVIVLMLTMGIERKAWAIDKEYICDFGSTYYACGPMVLSDDKVLLKNRVHGRVKVIIIAKESSQVEVWKEGESYLTG